MAAAGVSALAYAGVMVVARHQARQDALWTILLVQNVVPTLVLAAPLWWLWEPMRWSDVPILLLMGAAFTAIGCLASALTSSQIVAGIFTIGLLVIQYFLGFVTRIWGEGFPGAAMFEYISSQQHLHYFASGLFDTRPIVFYLSLTAFLLFLTYQVVDYRRWRR
jgi:uncharacterized membrane protein YfcA